MTHLLSCALDSARRAGFGPLVALALPILLQSAVAATAETITLSTELSAAAQVPPNPSKGNGSFTATYDTETRKLTWTGSYSGTTGQPTAMHFHGPADAKKNAPVVVDIVKFASPLEGSATLTEAQASDLLAGLWYVNLHTPSYPGGELRGQLSPAKSK